MFDNNHTIYTDAATVTKHDTNANVFNSFKVTGAGVVKVTTKEGTAIEIPVAANELVPIAVTLIWSTGTTSTGAIIGLK